MSVQLLARIALDKVWLRHVLPFGLLLAIQLALALLREQPLILADEAGYLANARYLSGAAHLPTFHGAHSYPFGYSLFLIPVFWLLDNPYTVYKASLVIGVLLMSTLYVSLYYVLTHLLGISPRLAMLAAFITCLSPPLLLRSNFAWAETAYVPGFMLLVALFGTLLRYKTVTFALVFGLHLGFMYTIHSRSLPLIPIALIYLTSLACLRALSWKAVGFAISGTALMFVTTRVVVEHLRTASGAEVLEIPIRPVVSHLLSLQGLYDLPLKMNEQVLYLAQSSFGLFPLGVLAIGLYLWQCRRTGDSGLLCNAPSGTLIFFLLAWIATLVFTSAFLGSIKDEAQFLIGRFIDGISGLYFALGLTTILRGKQWWSRRFGTVTIALLAGSTLVAIYSLPVLLPNAFEPGVFHYFALLGSTWRALIVASVVAAVGFVFFSLARGRWRFLAVAAIACLFLLTSAFGYFFAILPLQDRVARSSTLASYIRAYLGSPPTIAYDTASYHPLPYFSYEFLLPHSRFLPFNSAAGELPPAPIVISSRFWKDADTLDAHSGRLNPTSLSSAPIKPSGHSPALFSLPCFHTWTTLIPSSASTPSLPGASRPLRVLPSNPPGVCASTASSTQPITVILSRRSGSTLRLLFWFPPQTTHRKPSSSTSSVPSNKTPPCASKSTTLPSSLTPSPLATGATSSPSPPLQTPHSPISNLACRRPPARIPTNNRLS